MNKTLNLRLDIKAVGPREFEGYGSVYGNVDLGGDIVLPGAFAKSIARHKDDGTMPLMFWMHQADQVPGVWQDMKDDKQGLWLKGELVETTLGRDVRTLLDKKAVRGLSIGYRPVDMDWDRDGNRLLKQLDLHEVSIVSMAMNPLARIEAMKARLSAAGEYVPTEREVEQRLRTAGFSKGLSRRVTGFLFDDPSGGTPALDRWDAGTVDDDEQDELKSMLMAMHALTDTVGAAALRR